MDLARALPSTPMTPNTPKTEEEKSDAKQKKASVRKKILHMSIFFPEKYQLDLIWW